MRTSSGQPAAALQASRSTHSPMLEMSPVSSATGMNSAGEIVPLLGMIPAQQRLEAADAVGLEVEQRLVHQAELAARQGDLEPLLEHAAMLQRVVHAALEEVVVAAALALGAIERGIGVLEQRFDVVAVARRERDADRGADVDLVALDLHRLGDQT